DPRGAGRAGRSGRPDWTGRAYLSDAADSPGSGSNSYRPGVTSRRPFGPKNKLLGAVIPAARNCSVRILSPSRSYTYVYGTTNVTHKLPAVSTAAVRIVGITRGNSPSDVRGGQVVGSLATNSSISRPSMCRSNTSRPSSSYLRNTGSP